MAKPNIEQGPAGLREKSRRSPGSRPGPRHFRSGYEVGVPVLLGIIVLLLVALIVLAVLVLFHLVPF